MLCPLPPAQAVGCNSFNSQIESSPPPMVGGMDFEISLNNDRHYAPPDKTPEIVTECLNTTFREYDIGGIHAGGSPLLSQDKKRSILDSIFSGIGLPVHGSSPWQKIEALKSAIADVAGIENTTFQPFYRHNYLNCYRHRQSGDFLEFGPESDDQTPRVRKMNCGNPLCLWCADRKRKQLSSEYTEIFKQCLLSHQADKIWSIVFTLPASIENIPFNEVKRIRKEIPGVVKKAFGVKSRSNIGILVATHPVGDNFLMRTRWHFHVLVAPLELSKDSGVTLIERDSLDIYTLRELWDQVLPCLDQPIFPQVSYFSASNQKSVGRLAHRVKYDCRSFAGDVESAMLRLCCDDQVVILKNNTGMNLSYQAVPVPEYAAQVIMILQSARLQAYGWLRQRKTWIRLNYFTVNNDSALPVPISSTPCEIVIVRAMQFDRNLKKVVYSRSVIVMVAGRTYEVGKDVKFY